MKHTIKQAVTAAIVCLVALFIFSACQKHIEAKETLSGKQVYDTAENVKILSSTETENQARSGTPVVGGACTVTSGINQGKSGTYTKDEDGSIWCEGSWGGTECSAGKCAEAVPPSKPVPPKPPKNPIPSILTK